MGTKAREGTISIDEMSGGTFTISNGGVYGSMLSTPIINPPQSAILGNDTPLDSMRFKSVCRHACNPTKTGCQGIRDRAKANDVHCIDV